MNIQSKVLTLKFEALLFESIELFLMYNTIWELYNEKLQKVVLRVWIIDNNFFQSKS